MPPSFLCVLRLGPPVQSAAPSVECYTTVQCVPTHRAAVVVAIALGGVGLRRVRRLDLAEAVRGVAVSRV